ncbi:PIN domain-containing protein [Calditrichota bacterium LG25]
MILIDTDGLIWYLRGNEKAFEVVENQESFSISVETYIELVQGMRAKKELKSLRVALRTWQTNILMINEEISARAMFLVERYYLSHSLTLADALIASTTIVHGLPILTANDRHFKIVNNLEIQKFNPS